MNDSVTTRKSGSLPADLRTGVPAIDLYLEQINAHLIGSTAIRRATLSEARDFVVDATADAHDREAAIAAAIDEFGSPRDIGASQRRERHLLFLKLALMTGPIFAVLMLVASLLDLPPTGGGWGLRAGLFVFHMLAFGLGMGAIFAYIVSGSAPSTSTPGTGTGEDGFQVVCRKSSRVLCWILIVAFGAMQLLLLLGLFDADPAGFFNAWPWPLAAFVLVLGIKNVGAPIHALGLRAYATRQALVVHRLTGPLQLRRDQIIAVVAPGYLRQLFSPFYGNQRRIGWRADDGRRHDFTLSLTRDVVNGDRLLAWLESAVQENTASA